MKVLSLFNGISCWRPAFERAGIKVERGVNFEIDKYANQVAQRNYPNDEYNGDVVQADFTKYKGFDILIGGSPCTHWSIAKKGRETTSSGAGWDLFMQYKRALTESECRYFLYENNHSIHKDIKAAITQKLGVEPIMINSALVSAQNRKRCYWTNISGVTQPEDRGILLRDILESPAISDKEKAYTLRASAGTKQGISNIIRHIRSGGQFGYQSVFEPVYPLNICSNGKARTIKAQYHKNGTSNFITNGKYNVTCVAEPVIYQRPHGFNKGGIKTGKSPTLTANGDWQDNNYICEPLRIGNIETTAKDKNSQQYRVYSVRGKSICLCGNGGGMGAKTGLYYIDLPDGDYIIRKLTPVECERLQTLPDNYTSGISNTQRYKCLGNGWTVDVITHILRFLPDTCVNEKYIYPDQLTLWDYYDKAVNIPCESD